MTRRGGLAAAAAALALLPFVPGLDTDYGRSLLTQMAIAAVFALSFNLLFGQTGLLSFGHAVYFGLGGYAAIHAMRAINNGLPVPIVLVPIAGANHFTIPDPLRRPDSHLTRTVLSLAAG